MKINVKKLLIQIAIPLILGGLIGFIFKDSYTYIETLNRTIKIPMIVFPIVWTTLYILMGIWAYFYERDFTSLDKGMTVYWVSLFLNIIFIPLLFQFHLNYVAAIDTFALLVLVIYLFVITLKAKKKYAYLMLPYVIWMVLASTLMIDIILNN